jgi:hypothetical protein
MGGRSSLLTWSSPLTHLQDPLTQHIFTKRSVTVLIREFLLQLFFPDSDKISAAMASSRTPPALCQGTRKALSSLRKLLGRGTARKQPCYPRHKLEEFFTQDDCQQLRDLASCQCGTEGCASSDLEGRAFDKMVISRICKRDESYFSVLGLLCLTYKTKHIHNFLNENLTDQRLHEKPLTSEQFEELFGSHDAETMEFDFPKFFLPTLHYGGKGGGEQQEIPPEQVLPFDIESRVGSGSYGDVDKAQMLDKVYYHFPDATVSPLRKPP